LFEEVPGLSCQIVGRNSFSHININLESNKGAQESLILPDDHNVRAWRAELFEDIFNDKRSNIFSTSSDNKFLDSSGDEKESVLVYFAEIT